MPELPETETIARDLDRLISGRRIERVGVRKDDVLREVTANELVARVTSIRIERSWRRAKLIVLDLSSGDRLVVQPRFTGALLVDDGSMSADDLKFSTVAFTLDDGRTLHYRDVRRLGTLSLMSAARFESYTGLLGVEPLDPAFTGARLSGVLRGSSQAVKKVLMNQRRVAGIGNIYANEALYGAGIDPSRAADSLSDAEGATLRDKIVDVLRRSIAARGTSFRDYRDASGGRGGFVEHLQAYGRGGAPCHHCGTRLTETHAIDGRSTVFCHRCQG